MIHIAMDNFKISWDQAFSVVFCFVKIWKLQGSKWIIIMTNEIDGQVHQCAFSAIIKYIIHSIVNLKGNLRKYERKNAS